MASRGRHDAQSEDRINDENPMTRSEGGATSTHAPGSARCPHRAIVPTDERLGPTRRGEDTPPYLARRRVAPWCACRVAPLRRRTTRIFKQCVLLGFASDVSRKRVYVSRGPILCVLQGRHLLRSLRLLL